MTHPSRKFWTLMLTILAIVGLLTGMFLPLTRSMNAQAATSKQGTTPDYIQGPFTGEPTYPTVFNGDLRDLPNTPITPHQLPEPKMPKQGSQVSSTSWVDPLTQQKDGQGQMPAPIENFAGLDFQNWGAGWPPDTNGDVGPTYYIQTVNTSIGIFNKTTGALVVAKTYDDFFVGLGGVCDNANAGDPVVLYDPQVDRWLVTDFAWDNFNTGPFYECIAVSQTNDPVAGGWYFYQMRADTAPLVGYLNDYPKLGVWRDGWYMSANMFGNTFAVRVWALDRASAITGGPLHEIYFDCTDNNFCASLLPANVRGVLPPAGAPEYFANVMPPNLLNIWEFHVDFTTPGNSTFTGPVTLQTADFQNAVEVPQQGSPETLDSLGDRMMFMLQYRNINGVESLYATHSVITNAVDAIRWYEVRDPGGTPVLFQQGTYQPDDNFRWMGSIAADKEGNIAVGYSVSSLAMRPAIRYAGQLAGEIPNLLDQGEASLVEGTGSQNGGFNRWGDYSAITVDPVDDCTFWYTTEYYVTTGSNWQTRIGSFKYPSCGQPKGTISGTVFNAVTNLPIPGVPVVAVGSSYSFSSVTDASGAYSIPLIAGSYDVTAGPLLPGYPTPDSANLAVTPPNTTTHDFFLTPVPNLVHDSTQLLDPLGNNNGFPEPGEQGLELFEGLLNNGATTAEQVSASLTSLTPGVSISTADTTYPDIPVGTQKLNNTPYVFSLDQSVPCGSDLNFQATVTNSITTNLTNFKLDVGVPQDRANFYFNDVENGAAGWTTGGTPNAWAITTNQSHSPTHSWTDSPAGNYQNNANNWVETPSIDLTGVKYVQVSGWYKYALEPGYDYAYVEFSLDGGSSWSQLAVFNGTQATWQEVTLDAPMLDNQPDVRLRFHLVTDPGVVMDGLYVDDVAITSIPFSCESLPLPNAPSLVAPANNSWVSSPVTFEWKPADSGGAPTGYIFYLDNTPVITFTDPITTTTLDVSPWTHTWAVVATNASGSSQPSPTWTFDVFGKFYLPFVLK